MVNVAQPSSDSPKNAGVPSKSRRRHMYNDWCASCSVVEKSNTCIVQYNACMRNATRQESPPMIPQLGQFCPYLCNRP